MNNEPVAWMYEDASGTMKMLGDTRLEEWVTKFGCKEIPLYRHEDTIPYKDLHQVVKNVLAHPVKELTDDEIVDIGTEFLASKDCDIYTFARAILRKAQEK